MKTMNGSELHSRSMLLVKVDLYFAVEIVLFKKIHRVWHQPSDCCGPAGAQTSLQTNIARTSGRMLSVNC